MTDQERVQELLAKARAAQEQFESYSQEQVDEVVAGVAWAGYKEENARRLAELAYEHSGLGNPEDKFTKVRRKTLGTMRDLKGAKSVGVIAVDEERGLTTIAKPMGVIAAILPATNPEATPVNNVMITLKGRNAVILAPHPKGEPACAEWVHLARQELSKLNAPLDLVQYLSLRAENKAAGKARAQELMRQSDYVLVTAGPSNVDMGYRSGTPSHGVGVGNAPVIIDETADIAEAVPKIVASKTFDYATSCSSESALVIEASRYDEVLQALQTHGGYLVRPEEKSQLEATMWNNGRLNRAIVAQSPHTIAQLAGLNKPEALESKFLIVEEEGIGQEYLFSAEKLSVVLTVYKYHHFDEALDTVHGILSYMGLGHSCGIHSHNDDHIERLAQSTNVSTVLVNQPHCYNNGGSFDNGLDFTLSMGAGTWGDNDTCENLTYKHFLNFTYLARPIPPRMPTEEELWGDYVKQHGY
ncbi:MAG: acylating sulfoacetaldehyde dehydrogenase [Ardenticatenaceae bacterium]